MAAGDRFPPAAQRSDLHRGPPFRVSFSMRRTFLICIKFMIFQNDFSYYVVIYDFDVFKLPFTPLKDSENSTTIYRKYNPADTI
jgi:hypothetical protein